MTGPPLERATSLGIESSLEAYMGKVIAVASQKGGVGKTTTTVNLAASFASMQLKTLIIDLDEQGAAALGFGLPEAQTQFGIYDVFAGEKSLREVICSTSIRLLKVIPAGRGQSVRKKQELMLSIETPEILNNIIRAVNKSCDVILMDCPPGMGDLTMNALSVADSVLVPLQCEPLALKTLTQILRAIRKARVQANPALQIEGLLLTMYDPRFQITRQISEQVRQIFPAEVVFHTAIPRHEDLTAGFAAGRPIVIQNPQSKGAQAYLKVAAEIVKKMRKSQEVAAAPG
ncbi:MAG: ParA family protein [Deltaproteobacteria bacterium]|nr:MAG: ParA family protein [Deltaproteobacteria bacterium]